MTDPGPVPAEPASTPPGPGRSPEGPPGEHPRNRWGLAALGVATGAWRLATVPVPHLWRDWALLLGGYAVVLAVGRLRPLRPGVTAALMAFLLGLYVQGQWGPLWSLFRGGP